MEFSTTTELGTTAVMRTAEMHIGKNLISLLFIILRRDSAYPGEPWLLKPILNGAEGSPEAYYTEKHCQARNCVERCYGVMKGRFRCLLRDRVLHYHPVKAGRIVKACCVLHNMCRMVLVKVSVRSQI
ncbi:Putative nuclease [Frankliniella fusca]|uniref:Nuclease n=1 Tax=Frankliniella fusca TaxID=407009 RepID=A0AAE1HQS4_9NEOP|nr:Putative nuclease [Frankliniella fusca]